MVYLAASMVDLFFQGIKNYFIIYTVRGGKENIRFHAALLHSAGLSKYVLFRLVMLREPRSDELLLLNFEKQKKTALGDCLFCFFNGAPEVT